jgi:hypothetical protein
MKLIDMVAQMIYDGHKRAVENMEGTTIRELYQHTKQVTDCLHPKQSVTLQYIVRLGDVLQPRTVSLLSNMSELVLLKPTDRFVVYQLSCITPQYDLSIPLNENTLPDDIKVVMLKYEDVHRKDFSLFDFTAVMCFASNKTLTPLLDECDVVDNVMGQLD